MTEIKFRTEPTNLDIDLVREIVESTGFFYKHEIPVAVELVETRLESGIESGYLFVFAELEGKTIAFSCFGETPCTIGSYDLYWIVTHNNYRGKGIGKLILNETHKTIAANGGRLVVAETSSLSKYEPTRQFYLKNNYILEATIKDFYNINDDKLMFVKRLT